MDPMLFYVIAGIAFLFSLGVRVRLKSTYSRWSRVPSEAGMSGGEVARTILDANNLRPVAVDAVSGTLTDHYDPLRKRIRLSPAIFKGDSVAATAVAAHEAAHALQDATGYRPLEMRTVLLPLVNTGARVGLPLALLGFLFGSTNLVIIAMLTYAGSMLIAFLTLPVEFNASQRALAQLERLGLVSDEGRAAAHDVLRAAAMTYVAGAASSAGYLVYLLVIGVGALFGRSRPLVLPRG
jgi:Zn-dependent membrane protease YugP